MSDQPTPLERRLDVSTSDFEEMGGEAFNDASAALDIEIEERIDVMTDQPTPSERRAAIAAGLYRKIGALWPKNLAEETCAELADALMPKVEEWLAEAWDLGWHAMGDETISPAATEINPYRRSTP